MCRAPASIRPCRLLLVLLPLLAGCPAPQPWQGVTPERLARAEEHRLRGLALLEDDRITDAQREFAALQRLQPGLAFGYVNEAVALMRQTSRGREAVEAGRKGAERLPGSAWAQMVLGQAYYNAQQPEQATEAFERAVQLAPDEPRILGALARHLQSIPGDHSARLDELYDRLAQAAPDNLAAQISGMRAAAHRGHFGAAITTLDRLPTVLGKIPTEAREHYERARADLGVSAHAARGTAQVLYNVMKAHPRFTTDQNVLFGNDRDPADLAMRDWGTPPPNLPGPPLPEVAVTWKDVSAAAGLAGVTARGVAPVAIGDVEMVQGSGRSALLPAALGFLGVCLAAAATLGRRGRRSALAVAAAVAAVGAAITGTLRPARARAPILDTPDLAVRPGPDGLLLNRGGRYSGAPGPAAPGSPVLADLDNNFSLDLYTCTPAGDRVWKNPASGQVTDGGLKLTLAPGQPFVPGAPVAAKGEGVAMPVDLDLDGDLDFLRTSSAPGEPAVRYLRNNGNLTFTDLTRQSGLWITGGARHAVYGDFDNDADPDVFLVRPSGECRLFLNLRQDQFRDATRTWGVDAASGARAAVVADPDRDDDWDVLIAGRAPHGSVLYRNEGGRFQAQRLPNEADWVEVLDYDNDTWLDLAFAGPDRLRVVHNDSGKLGADTVVGGPAAWVGTLDHDQDGDLDLLATDPTGQVRLHSNEGGNARPWIRAELEGLQRHEEQTNNPFAIGAIAEIRTPWDSQKQLVRSPQIHVGLGRARQATVLRVLWTHGVPQSLVAPRTGDSVRLVQTPKGSCPFLYVWDGERWQFHADFNWKSPLGMLFTRGAAIPHDQTLDWIKIPGEKMVPVGGYYRLIATEELREISYFDMLRLVAVDHPADTEIFVDERFKMGPPDPFNIYTARRPRLPRGAHDGDGRDLLPALAAQDNVYTPVPPGPIRGVCPPHDLVLDLGGVPDPSRVRLFLNGWIYPAGTSGNVAAAQNPDLPIIPPTLYVGDGKGGWKEADRNIGLPCGKRKTLVLDLSGKLVPGDPRVKLTTTMEIRWDRVFLTSGEAPVRTVQTPMNPVEADLRERGVGRRYQEVPDGPDLFDYQRPLRGHSAPGWPDIPGAYTRLGDCAPLLQTVDDHYVIAAPGDEIQLLFDARALPGLPSGWKRDFVFLSDGWTKDTDPNTVGTEQVGPLPFHGMTRYPYGPEERFPRTPVHNAWQREWNTRRKGPAPAARRAGAVEQP